MKRWALVVAALYLLILVILTVPVTLLAFAPDANVKDIAEAYTQFPYWLWVGVMVLGQAALLPGWAGARCQPRAGAPPLFAAADCNSRVDDGRPRRGGDVFPV